ncbi:MAG: DUF262 domain-containing protein [Symploca sp. SIO2D2]|nr:DUF262 domain-containing protein [Symploca sp. SIO2D2]
MFFIPKYQRAYAWNYESVSDFVKDLKNCFDRRKSGSPISHFWGGILSVKYPVSGTVNQHEYEIIDGQQRIATFTLLVSCLIKTYSNLKLDSENSCDTTNASIIERRMEELSSRYVEFHQEVQRIGKTVEVVKLSKADHPFYKELIRNMTPSLSPSRDSHHKILKAYETLYNTVNEIISLHSKIEDKIDDLEIIQNILDNDFTILHMVTGNRNDAFRLFQVINDRGTSLTDGDLLRAKTLELLEGLDLDQDTVERLWDDILVDPPSATANYLNWIYESYQGKRAKQNALFDMFLDKFFPQHQSLNLTVHEAQTVRSTMINVNEDILKCRSLIEGQWLYPIQQPITSWDRTRLNILLVELSHTLSIPLFIAAAKLDHRNFSDIVQIVERAFFRYKLICNQNVTPLKNIYAQEALSIRQDPISYDISSLRTKLQNLIDNKASDQTFINAVATLVYQESGGSNKPLKYFLMTVEYYYNWYKKGASGTPVCVDKSRVYDFAGTSIEHVYPRNATGSVLNPYLEPLKNTLGNLTIMDPAQNSIGGNDSFTIKKPLYQASSVDLTKEIGLNQNWGQSEVEAHKKLLIDAAVQIFRP